MKIVLISTSTYPSDQGLRTISSCLKREGYEVKMVFMPMAEDYSLEYSKEVLGQLKEICRDAKLIGISAYASTSVRAEQLINYLKQLNVPIVWGGPHATISPDMCIKQCDIVCRGEGEDAMLELAKKVKEGKDYSDVSNLWIRKGDEIIKNEISNMPDCLDCFAPPDYDLEDHYLLEGGKLVPFREKHLNGMIFFMTTRGCPNACAYCFSAGALVETKEGVLPIEEITPGMEVLCADSSWHFVKTIFKRAYKGKFIKILPLKIGEGIVCTAEHKILVYRNNRIAYVKAAELTDRDMLCLPLLPEIKHEIDLFTFLKDVRFTVKLKRNVELAQMVKIIELYKNSHLSTRQIASITGISKSHVQYIIAAYKNKEKWVNLEKKEIACSIQREGKFVRFTLGRNKIKRIIKLNKNLCRLFGYYLAEGSINKYKERPNSFEVIFSFGRNELAYINDARNIIVREFGIEPSIVNDVTTTKVSISNSIIAHLFNKLFGTGSRIKSICPVILELPKPELKQLLCGYIRGDGDTNLLCSTVSRNLAYQIQLIGFKCGYSPGVYRCNGTESVIQGRIIKSSGYYYAISFKNSQNENELYYLTYGKKKNRTQNSARYKVLGNYALLPIKQITEFESSKPVFNIEVSSEHNYTVSNIIVKNCCNHLYRQLYHGHGKLLRGYTINYVIKELKRLKNKFPSVGVFDIRDETFFARPLSEIKEFAERYQKEVGVRWKCLADPTTMSEEKLQLLVDAGLTDIIIGIQSGSDRVNFEVYKRFIKREQVLKAAKIANKFKGKLAVMYDMITTNPYENPGDVLDSINLLREIPKPYFLSVNNLVFFLGTPLYEKAIADGIIKSKKDSASHLNYWDRWNHIKLKKKNAYLNLILNLMRGPVTDKRYGIIPAPLLKKLISKKAVDYNLKHKIPTYTAGQFVLAGDYFREHVAKPLYRNMLPTSMKVWYDKVRYRV